MPLMQYAYPKAARLLKKIQFLRLKQGSQKRVYPEFILNYKPNDVNQARLGVIVSKRVCKKAVIRNAFKRQIRESFRLNRHLLNNIDIVVIVKQKQAKVNKVPLRNSLEEAWNALKKR